MRFDVAFRGMRSSEALKVYTREKIHSGLVPLVKKPIGARVTFSMVGPEKFATCHLYGGDGLFLGSAEHSEDAYVAVDQAIETLRRRLKRRKEKVRAHQHKRRKYENFRAVAC